MTWAEQTDKLRTFQVRRGRPFNLDRVEASTAHAEFNNPDGFLDPANAGSTYYPNILPLKELWFSRREDGITYNRFRGPIERYAPVWAPPHHQFIEIDAADAFETLANITLVSGSSSLTTLLTGTHNDLVFTARNAGGHGDAITITYVVSGNNTPLGTATNTPLLGNAFVLPQLPAGVTLPPFLRFLGGGGSSPAPAGASAGPITLEVQGTDITVTVATNGAGAATSTAAQVKTALEANNDVMALVSVALAPANDGTGVVTVLTKTNLSGGKWVSELSGTRITRVLDMADWPADKRLIDPGSYTVISQGFSETDNVSVLTHAQDVASSELGYVFIDGNGNFVFHDGGHRQRETRSTVSQATFSDDGTGFAYRDLSYGLDKDRIVNEVICTAGGEGAVAQIVEDTDSQLAYSPFPGVPIKRSLSKATLLENDADALTVAEAILAAYKDPHTRFETISLLMPADSASWTAAVLRLEIGDLVTVRTSPPVAESATAYTISYDCFVESIEDTMSPGSPWQVSFQVTPISEALSGPPDPPPPPPPPPEGDVLNVHGNTLIIGDAVQAEIGA